MKKFYYFETIKKLQKTLFQQSFPPVVPEAYPSLTDIKIFQHIVAPFRLLFPSGDGDINDFFGSFYVYFFTVAYHANNAAALRASITGSPDAFSRSV